MSQSILQIEELRALDERRNLIRIPAEQDVPITPRMRKLIDTPQFQRLSKISQLGLVSKVYPGATHTRSEHSLGVYRIALLFLRQLCCDSRFVERIDDKSATVFLIAALFHDVGHWPFCHPIEDIGIANFPQHEELAVNLLNSSDIQSILESEFSILPEEVSGLLCGKSNLPGAKILSSMLSGPIDIDKMDYLFRDSLHAGVPYGQNFDRQRLIGSLCVNSSGDGLAISEKGKTAAEMMVFARYVMFSEVYWHHAVRSATAMLQRVVYECRETLKENGLFECDDDSFYNVIHEHSKNSKTGVNTVAILNQLFGNTRQLYKRLARYSCFENGEAYERLARKPYCWLVDCSENFAELLSAETEEKIGSAEVIFDAPPVAVEVQFNLEVYFESDRSYRWLSEVSPVVKTLAERQFDDFVKCVRIFVHPRLVSRIPASIDIEQLIMESVKQTETSFSD